MKKLIFVLFAVAIGICLQSCLGGQPLVKTKAQNNETYKVDYLFEHDGCRVYRFYDDGKYVYFTNCTGSTSTASSDSTKTRVNNVIIKRVPKTQ